MKKELFELKRNMRIELCNITKITGYIVDNDRNCRLEFVKNFLNLEETEIFKYLDIFKRVLSGKPGRNMFQLDFKEKTRKQHLATIVKTGLEDNDVRQIFLEEIAESIGIEIGLPDAHVTVSADRTDLVTLEMINGERYIMVKADGDINANGIILENREGEKDEEEDD